MSSRKTKEDMDDAIAKWAGKDEVALSLEAKRAAASPRVPKLKEVKVESAVSAWLGDGEKGAGFFFSLSLSLSFFSLFLFSDAF